MDINRKHLLILKRNALLEKQLAVKNRELEIESSLEKVRAVAMEMKEPADMLGVCKTISQQLKSLGVKEIRNVQTAIFYESRGTYMNYEYYTRHRKTIITETSYTNHKVPKAFAKKMLQGRGEIFITHIKGQKVKDWIAYQKTTNVFIDRFLEKATSLNYYWYSLGPVALGMSTYMPLDKEDLNLFNRFRTVFELAYRRFVDIEKAEAQAKEAMIEASLERVRAQAMSMQAPNDLLDISKALYTELKVLGFKDLRNAMINIHNDDKGSFLNYDYSGYSGKTISDIFYNTHPVIKRQVKQARRANDAFSEAVFKGKDLQEWKAFRKKSGEPDDPRVDNVTALYYYFYSIGNGVIGISNFSAVDEEKLGILKRFRNVFALSYQRYTDIALAEAQVREAKIEAALERTRTQSMIMQHSKELDDTLRVFHEQVLLLGIKSAFSFLWLPDEEKERHIFWAAWAENNSTAFKSKAINYPLDRNEPATAQCLVDWKGNEPVVSYHVLPSGVENYFAAWQELIDGVEQLKPEYFSGGLYYVEAFMKYGCFGVMVATDLTEDEKKILGRFATEFERTYRRFLDLQKAEVQARESQIQLALERVRARTMAMQKSEELPEAANLLFQQVQSLGMSAWSAGYCIWDEDEKGITAWMSSEGVLQPPFKAPVTEDELFIQMREGYEHGKTFHVVEMGGEKLVEHYKYMRTLPVMSEVLDKIIEAGYPLPTFQIMHHAYFSKGFLLFITYEPVPEAHDIFKRFGKVFDQTYTRFLDLEKAEAQAEQARVNLIQIQTEKKRAEEALTELKATQAQLIQSEKMASLGELTAGIAHEIQNPLNFVNNFSEVSSELIIEMVEEVNKGNYEEVKAIADDVKQNLDKINHHGKRAGDIVKGMLQHSRTGSGQKELTDINALCDEYLRLSYHGLRAKDKTFNAKFETDFDNAIQKINVVPQDLGRVILNLINNAFYAVSEKKKLNIEGYEPVVIISTKRINDKIEVKVTDNGNGIPENVIDKIFQPFFTTKPTGQGTGLGLSLSYDIIKAHGGELKMETTENEGSAFVIKLPAN